jgi:hypothetical protein
MAFWATGKAAPETPPASPKRREDAEHVGVLEPGVEVEALPMVKWGTQTIYLSDVCDTADYADYQKFARVKLSREDYIYLKGHCPGGLLEGNTPYYPRPIGAVEQIEAYEAEQLAKAEELAGLLAQQEQAKDEFDASAAAAFAKTFQEKMREKGFADAVLRRELPRVRLAEPLPKAPTPTPTNGGCNYPGCAGPGFEDKPVAKIPTKPWWRTTPALVGFGVAGTLAAMWIWRTLRGK